MRISRRLLLFLIVLAAIPVQVLAKGVPARITISGVGIDGEMTISDVGRLEAFAALNEASQSLTAMPEVDVNTGYRIDRYMVEDSLSDTHTYYPDPDGGLGYLFCNTSQTSGMYAQRREKWFRATPAVDAIMKEVIADAATHEAESASLPLPQMIGGLGALGGVLLLITGVLEVRKRRNSGHGISDAGDQN